MRTRKTGGDSSRKKSSAKKTGRKSTQTTSRLKTEKTRSRHSTNDEEISQPKRHYTEKDTKRSRRETSDVRNKTQNLRHPQSFGDVFDDGILSESRHERRMRRSDRSQIEAQMRERIWPEREMEEEEHHRMRNNYRKYMYGPVDENGYAIRKGTEMYLPGYEDVDRELPQTRKHVDLHRGHDDYPSSFTNPNLFGGLPDEDYYESRSRELYGESGRRRRNGSSEGPMSRTRNYMDDVRSRHERGMNEEHNSSVHKRSPERNVRNSRRNRRNFDL